MSFNEANKNSNNSPLKSSNFKSLRFLINYLFKWIVIALAIGCLIGSASALFLTSLEFVTQFRENHLWIISLLPLVGLIIGLLYHHYGKSVEAGNNLIIANIQNPKEIISFKMAPMVYFGTLATHLFGGSAGREGTALQMSAAIADQFSKPFKLSDYDRTILLTAAVAGGFGSVFGTPIAGAIFALEFSKRDRIQYEAIFPAAITALFANFITGLWQVDHTHYFIPEIPTTTFINLTYTIIAGIIFGICARFFSLGMKYLSSFFKSYIQYPPLRPFVGGLIVVFCIGLLGTTKYIGLGIPTIVTAFENQLPYYDFAIKFVLTVITLSTGFKGGEVTPLFFIGATLGSALSFFIPLPTGLLAGMGFVTVFAGATNTPIACIMMAMELFGLDCGIYVTIACIVAYYISGNTSIYSQQLVMPSTEKSNYIQ